MNATIEFLKNYPPAIEGSGGNNHTYILFSKLVADWKLSPEDAFNLAKQYWNSRCQPPWNEDELKKIAENASKYASNFFDESWPPLISLEDYNLPTPPKNVFPNEIEEFLLQLSAASETPYDLVFILFLAMISVAVKGKYEIKVDSLFSEPCPIWVLAVLEPGSRKSFVFSKLSEVFNKIEKNLQISLKNEVKKNKMLIEVIDSKIAKIKKQIISADSTEEANLIRDLEQLEREKPDQMHLPRLRVGDITVEKLCEILKENNEIMALLSDEGGFLQNIGGRYSNNTPNFDLFLQSYSRSSVRVDRKNLNEPIHLTAPCLTIAATVQPIILEQLSAKPEFKHVGLLSRFLYCVPKSNLGFRNGTTSEVSTDLLQKYESLISQIFYAEDKGGDF